MRYFCQDNIFDTPEDLTDWTAQALLGRLAPKLADEMSKLTQLPMEEQIKIMKVAENGVNFIEYTEGSIINKQPGSQD